MLSTGPTTAGLLQTQYQQCSYACCLLQMVSMEDDMTMPEGWGSHSPPPPTPWTDASIYELHIRDFRHRPSCSLWCHCLVRFHCRSCLSAVCLPAHCLCLYAFVIGKSGYTHIFLCCMQQEPMQHDCITLQVCCIYSYAVCLII